ncbi:MAG TPA: aminopeptidase P N-terminal domain-containing protein [Burkholderiaceae bacterium]|nr:aminopeptidase P N-terminal domain-containing protein [Burkholderiaceae bacterium]
MIQSSQQIYKARRARFAQSLGEGGIAIIPTATEKKRNRDSDFLYRFDSYFYYLTGFAEPNALLVITGSGQSILFCAPKDQEREIWDGYRLGPANAPDYLGVDSAFSYADLDQSIQKLLENKSLVSYPFAIHAGFETRISEWLSKVRERVRFGVSCPDILQDSCAVLDEMRLIKDVHELSTMRRAAQISASGHMRAMKVSKQMLSEGRDTREYHLDAELLHAFRQSGAQHCAYSSIVAGGANACVLHYRADAGEIRNGDLVLIDAACELDGYASDITRTFPANGKFTDPQRTLYEIVLASQEAAIKATKSGARFLDPHEASVKVLAQGMLDVGLLDRNKVGDLQDVIESRAYFDFYMHRTGHWLGLDVHDCGSYTEPTENGTSNVRHDPLSNEAILDRPSRILKPGMVLTIEPGIYVRPSSNVPEKFHNIGIRIEDDAVVEENGCELISRSVPVAISDIEALMR